MTDANQIDEPDADESLADRVRSHIKGNRTGMIQDLAFAVVWVTIVSVLYDFVFSASPRWVLYMFMLAGIPAYFGFFISLEMARAQ
ncbi:hypothetical protein [Halorubrum lacusprofundi]|jgi:hypothetical protein|uniref:DUF8119 domain-containing protein n=1 Tax=Halorubrum lacusprofundi (strain ATCC 49239 / DSM 5036 / JCM 8891 / ACAM 34) TaxID=416348 RepID=B9LNG4_HALLT|nr:hypothetical protein [Halorubrum lacusprofundi]ACM56902.1 hypothetical protein Hlac_1310 [Halorubrum lacusprofundi ATCC 49239]MCG1006535.1 hypothetical protein [Halorubrum lacusprofundi]